MSNIKGETPEMMSAFNEYVALGHGRSLRKLSDALGISKATIETWCLRYEWQDRIHAMNEAAREVADEKIKKSFFRNIENLRKFKFAILDELKHKFEHATNCSECGNSPLEVIEMVRIWEVIKTELGEPTSITKAAPTPDDTNPLLLLAARLFVPTAPVRVVPDEAHGAAVTE